MEQSEKQCATCGVVLPKRRFISRAGVKPDCPACRRKASNRAAQKRHYAKVKAEHGAYLKAHDRALKDLLVIATKQANAEIHKNMARIKQMEKIESPIPRTVLALERRRALHERLLKAKEAALRDAVAGVYKPFFEYIQREDTDIVDGEL